MILKSKATVWFLAYDNNIDALIPEVWANESLAILEENMVAAQLVHRDFSDEIARYGDVVHTNRPGEFAAKRKTNADNVTIQDVTSTDVQVPLNQHVHVSFMIKDGEESKAMKDLIEMYMAPAMLAQARFIDQIILMQYPQFLANNAGALGGLTASNARDYILDVRNVMNRNKAYLDGRNFMLTPNAETTLLKLDLFTQAQQVGDNGTALQNATLGRKLGFNFFMTQNMASVAAGNTAKTGAVNLSGGYAKGSTVLVVDGFTGAVATGEWLTIAGDDTPYRIAAHTETATDTTGITLHTGLRKAVANDAVIKVYTGGAVNLVAGYAAGYAKEIVVDGFTVAPQVGQTVSFGASATSAVYGIIGVTGTTGITLDRPLDAALVNDAPVNIGPPGEYNLVIHRNAIALVVRPLALPKPQVGAMAAVVNYNGLSMRAVITYNGSAQGHLVTLDMLCGIAILDTNLGAVLLG